MPAPAPAAKLQLPRAGSSIGEPHPADGQLWRYGYEVVNAFPHDPKAYTQGLVFLDGKLLEVLNGFAYDAANDRLFVTGNFWPKVFEVRLRHVTSGG